MSFVEISWFGLIFGVWGLGFRVYVNLFAKASSITCLVICMIIESCCEMPISKLVLQFMFMWPVLE